MIDPNGKIIIPVVFHVLYHRFRPQENISDAVINSQIDRLNADFRKQNSDIVNVPSIWANLAADLNIEFKLACIDPYGNPTNGIERVMTSNPNPFCQFVITPGSLCADAQLSSLYGADAWSPDTYLNIWVCEMEVIGGVAMLPWLRFGYEQFDGIILDYRVVGENSLSSYYNKGRVATHEVGHWLGLYHVYQGNCFAGGDIVGDTPPQAIVHTDCPTFPQTETCSPNSPGVMFMNYMDQTRDDCKYFFTIGQRDRARSYFSEFGPLGTRFPFLNNYFRIKIFPSNPYIVQNNTITVYMKNPACLDVTYSFTGPVTEISHDNHKIIFSVVCPSSGTISLTANAANYTDNYIFDFVNTAGCPTALWPKVYDTKAPEYLGKSNNGNILMVQHEIQTFIPNINHQGFLPNTPPSGWEDYTFHYTTGGITNWTKQNVGPLFIMNSGDVQLNDYSYVNSSTGAVAPPPVLVPFGEKIIAERGIGDFLSMVNMTTPPYSGTIFIHSPIAGTTTLNTGYIGYTKFNPLTNKLFVIQGYPNAVFQIYSVTSNSFTLLTSNSAAGIGEIVQIDNQDKVYVIQNGVLKEYDYNSPIPIFPPLTINGFSNNNLSNVYSYNPYTENLCFVIQSVESKLYFIDLLAETEKYTTISVGCCSMMQYVFDGNDLYLAARNLDGVVTIIGNQQIPYVNSTQSTFLTKLNLQSDFSSRPSGSSNNKIQSGDNLFTVTLYPNPASNDIKAVIDEKNNLKESVYSVSIIDQITNRVMRRDKYQSGSNLNISGLKPGVYYLVITNDKGEKFGKIFSKL